MSHWIGPFASIDSETVTAAPGPSSGFGASASGDGTTNAGSVSVTTGTGSSAGLIVSVTFPGLFYDVTQVIVGLQAANADTAGIQTYVESSMSGFDIFVITPPSDTTVYSWNYVAFGSA